MANITIDDIAYDLNTELAPESILTVEVAPSPQNLT